MTDRTLRIGLAGLGTVGCGVIKLLEQQATDLRTKTGYQFKVTAVSARDKSKKRDIDLASTAWVDIPADLVARPDVDLIIEVMGGDGDPALSLHQAALKSGKPVITANKSLLARHGVTLAHLAETTYTPLHFEAAVAGGIPVIKALREGFAANTIEAIYGILNGTCNYILTAMEQTGRDFADILSEAQKLGYAEADPALDIGGGDTAHKLTLLTSLAFGSTPNLSGVSVAGIEHVQADDINAAREFDYRIKLIAQAFALDDGRILQMVAPSLVPKSSPLAHVNGVLNGIEIASNFAGPNFMAGRGAGAGPTASAIVADLIDIAQGRTHTTPFARPIDCLYTANSAGFMDWHGSFYMRLIVKDEPGVLADIAPILRDHGISIESLVQKGQSSGHPVKIIILTHKTQGQMIKHAVDKISLLKNNVDAPFIMPILAI